MEKERITTDILVIGSGGAGLTAAIHSMKYGLNVLAVSKGKMKDCATWHAAGDITYSTAQSEDTLFEQVVRTGGYLNNQALVDIFVGALPQTLEELNQYGVKTELKEPASPRRPSVASILPARGETLVRVLRTEALARNVNIRQNIMVTRLLQKDGTIAGAVAIDFLSGKIVTISAKAVILATGGGAVLFAKSDNPKDTVGDGIVLGFDAGAELVDVELISFYMKEEKLRQMLERHGLSREELFKGSYAHYFLGGIRIGQDASTNVRGLFAAGEATGGLFGAARLGGSALADSLVFGRIAGENAADYCEKTEHKDFDGAQCEKEEKTIGQFLSLNHQRDVSQAEIRSKIRKTMWEYAGIMKTEESLRKCLGELEKAKGSLPNITASTPLEMQEAFEAQCMLKLGQTVALASLERCESRGCFWRLDYPTPDAQKWQRNIVVREKGGMIELETESIPTTRAICFETPLIGAGCFRYHY